MHEEPDYNEVVCRNGDKTDLMYHKAIYEETDRFYPPIFCLSCYCENADCIRNRRNPFKSKAMKAALEIWNEQHPFDKKTRIRLDERNFEYYCLDYEEFNHEWD